MGRRRKASKKKNGDTIWELANSVTDEEIKGFTCEFPSEEDMDRRHFPNPSFKTRSLDWLGQNMLIGIGEWGEAWSVVYQEDNIDNDDFSSYPEEKKSEYRRRMVTIARRSRRVLLYKKWMYVSEKISKEKNEGEWAWDEEWGDNTNIVGGIEVGGDGNEAEVGGDGNEAEVGGDGNEAEVDGNGNEAEVGGDGNEAEVGGDGNEAEVGGDGNEAEVGGDVKEEIKAEEAQMDEGRKEPAATSGDIDLEDFYPFPADGTLIIPVVRSDFDFPNFCDRDYILYYEKPFFLGSWLKKHESTGSRWLQFYNDWSDKYKWETVEDWVGHKLGRECSAVIQSIVVGVLDYHSSHGPHGHLSDMRNFKLSQYVDNFGGVKKIRFKTELLNPDHNLQSKIMGDSSRNFEYLAKDMYDLTFILQKFLAGGELDSELDYFLNLLSRYPFSEKNGWKNHLLRNFPGLWDGQERAGFLVNFYYTLMSDLDKSDLLYDALHIAPSLLKIKMYGWITKIPVHSGLYDILLYSDHGTTGIEEERQPRYREGSMKEIARYMGAVLRHHNENQGNALDIRLVELCLSRLFRGVLLAIYMGMCYHKIYLN
ncbi:hypothetical protein OROHE_001264 [Orobanche hederae]